MEYVSQNNEYYINKIENNNYNKNEYFYNYKTTGIIEIKNGKWFYNLYFFIINNLNLPPNTFLFDFKTPTQQINDITMNISPDQTLVNNTIPNYESCKIYESFFEFDTNGDEFFNEKITDVDIINQLNFNFNGETLNNLEMNIDQNILNKLIYEIYDQQEKWDINYSNYYFNSEKNGTNEIIYKYNIDSKTYIEKEIKSLSYKQDNYVNIDKPIKNLLSIESKTAFNIIEYKVKINYQNKQKLNCILEYENKIPSKKIYNFNIDFLGHTLYDQKNDNIVQTYSGVEGFYIPFQSSGNYFIELLLEINGCNVMLTFYNNFSFDVNEIFYKIQVVDVLINNLTDFKRIYL